ncbi:MAG: hypothetical protein NVS3B10_09340 [Polyangiales bacterium]
MRGAPILPTRKPTAFGAEHFAAWAVLSPIGVVAGCALAFALGVVVHDLPGVGVTIALSLLVVIIVTCEASAQAIVLHEHVRRAGVWVVGSALGATLAVSTVIAVLDVPGCRDGSPIVPIAAGLTVLGAVQARVLASLGRRGWTFVAARLGTIPILLGAFCLVDAHWLGEAGGRALLLLTGVVIYLPQAGVVAWTLRRTPPPHLTTGAGAYRTAIVHGALDAR